MKISILVFGFILFTQVCLFGQSKADKMGIMSYYSSSYKKNSVIQQRLQYNLKSYTVEKQRLDSIITMNAWKEVCLYDSKNNVHEYTTSVWDTTKKKWVQYALDTYEYTEKNAVSHLLRSVWDTVNKNWNPYWQETYTADEAGNIVLYVADSMDVVNKSWIPMWKYETEFYSPNVEKNYTVSVWSKSLQKWSVTWREEYTLDAKGNRIQNLGMLTDLTDNQIIRGWKEDYTIDENNNKIQLLGSNWNLSLKRWEQSWKESYSCDSYGNTTQILSYNWSSANSQWNVVQKGNYIFNTTFSINNLIIPYWSIREWKYMPTNYELQYWDTVGKQWQSQFKKQYFYSSQTLTASETEQIENKNSKLIYNSMSKTLTVDLPDSVSDAIFILYEISGTVLAKQTVKDGFELNVSQLVSGGYVYQILIEDYSQSDVLIIK